MALAVAAVGCDQASTAPAVHPVYDHRTRQLVRLDADQDRDGRIDVRSYMAVNVPLRTEIDTDRDNRIDRWEYVDGESRVFMIGSSSRGDGLEDRWTLTDLSNGERTLLMSRARDRRVDRREFYRDAALVRAEEDANADGRPDRWEVWRGGVLRELSFDSAGSSGRADSRLRYDAGGRFELFEVDRDRDGQFSPPPPGQRPPVPESQ
jgi:hypothetical protein